MLAVFVGALRQDIARFEGHLHQRLLRLALVMQPLRKRSVDAL
jgi:hypothetical protein